MMHGVCTPSQHRYNVWEKKCYTTCVR